jgi:arylsulfatase A-like enzyme
VKPFAAAALALAALPLACTPAAGRLNVVLLVMDTTRGDRCSFTGYGRPTTPRLDEFAKDAAVYTDAWTPAGWTGPAHASLFTGLRPEHHGFDRGWKAYLGEEHATLAEHLQAAGYATGCFTNNSVISEGLGLVRGFETVDALYRDEKRPSPWAAKTHADAAAWAEAAHAAGRPFFVFINDMEPHLPYTPPVEVATAFVSAETSPAELEAARATDHPADYGQNTGKAPLPPRRFAVLSDLYDAEIATLDREIGTFLDRLRADGLLDSTIVVIAGDHGENLGEHGMMAHVGSLHRTITHVPLLVRDPRGTGRGARIASVVRLEDVFPTLIEACGLPPVGGIDGVTLSRDFDGRVARATLAPNEQVRRIAEQFFPGSDATRLARGIESVYDGRHHLLVWSDGETAAYDVTRDPGETTDLARGDPGLVARMRALLSAGR